MRKYWKLIIQIDPTLRDIYGDFELSDENISVDHFVPWQYVAHDELWNLHPTTKSINSSKSNLLPSWELYFNSLGRLEYRAYELKNQNELVEHEFQKIALYHLNNQEIRNQLYADGLDKNTFIERLEHVIKPVYESAQMSGFNAYSLVDYAEVIIALCNGVLNTPKEQLERKWGIESDISKLIIALYDETANSDKEAGQKIAENCL